MGNGVEAEKGKLNVTHVNIQSQQNIYQAFWNGYGGAFVSPFISFFFYFCSMLRNLWAVRARSRSAIPSLQCARSYATPTPELLDERNKKLNELNVKI